MKNLIETIKGKKLMERLKIDEHELFQIVRKKALPAFKLWEDSFFKKHGFEGRLKKRLQDETIQLFGKPNECDYMDSAGNTYKRAYPFEPEQMPSLIFKLSDIESFKKESKETEPGKVLPCDPGTRWKDIEIILTSYETVTVKTPKGTGRFHFSKLNFDDGRGGDKSTKLWTLLSVFCKYSGRITSETPIHGFKDLPKSISDLNKKLQNVFGINETFHHRYNNRDGWIAKCVFNDKTV